MGYLWIDRTSSRIPRSMLKEREELIRDIPCFVESDNNGFECICTSDRLKKAKEDLEQFLLENDKMMSTTKYYKCEEMFGNLEVWRAVGDSDRRDIYEDVIFNLAKREKEDAKQLKKRNTKRLAQVLDTMTDVTYKTTWQEAQVLLLQHSAFAEDADLLQMDKEDALLVFENHIRQLEKDEEEEKECEKKRRKRQERKNRDAFIVSIARRICGDCS